MIKILSTQSSRIRTNASFNTGEDIEALTQAILGTDSKIIYEYNIPASVRLIQRKEVRGIVIPDGHGAVTCVANLESYLGKIPIPVFRAFETNYNIIARQYQDWLKQFL